MMKDASPTVTEMINREKPLSFAFDGQQYTGFDGDTIASALYRAGVRTFSRGFKYHRPRGLFCVSGNCPNCLINADGTPNLPACTMRIEADMEVKSQNAWPSLKRDVMSLTDKLSAFLPVGFYYKTMIQPRSLWSVYETILRNIAGVGVIDPDPESFSEPYYDKQYRHADVTVVGGGPAGLSAARAAAGLGAQVLLIDENSDLGGHVRYQNADFRVSVAQETVFDAQYEHRLGNSLAYAVQQDQNIDILTRAVAFGWYGDNWIGVSQDNRLIKLRTNQLIVATGRIEQPLIFQNNDLPGIMLGTGLQRLIQNYKIQPGRRALVVTSNNTGWQVANNLLEIGVDVVGILDARQSIPETETARTVQQSGVEVLLSHTIRAATGRQAVTGAVAVRLNADGQPICGSDIHFECDLISLSVGFVPNNALLYQSGAEIHFNPQHDNFVVESLPPDVHGAGHAMGTTGLVEILMEGRIAGLTAALACGNTLTDKIVTAREQLQQLKQQLQELDSNWSQPVLSSTGIPGDDKKAFVCLCEDVTEQDLKDAIGEGFDDIETLKRYSTISMGPCQGKMCSANSIRLCARETKRTIEETGRTTSRPPFRPVKLGTLAGRKHSPVRYTPLHEWHIARGATMMNAGPWKRPEHYGDPAGEVKAVHTGVGIIDVSTLGKLDVRGPDVVPFLERIYTNILGDLDVGRIRYGVMCTEEGIIFDDGVVCRLDGDHFYVTTTSSGISSVYEWLEWWLATWNMRVHVTNVTASYAAINVAGPKAHEVVGRLTDVDLSTKAFPYMHWRDVVVASVPARLLRIGFVGEISYEIHYPAEYGVYLWTALMEAGNEFNIRPFGIEAQRLLRLEKKHIIVGHDTDALSDPFGVGMGWVVKLDKDRFIGKPSLMQRMERGPTEQLIGFEIADSSVVPHEGEQIVEDGTIIGRVTSARYSTTLSKSIGMGWVSATRAHEGDKLNIRTNGRLVTATVVSKPFYDPSGERYG